MGDFKTALSMLTQALSTRNIEIINRYLSDCIVKGTIECYRLNPGANPSMVISFLLQNGISQATLNQLDQNNIQNLIQLGVKQVMTTQPIQQQYYQPQVTQQPTMFQQPMYHQQIHPMFQQPIYHAAQTGINAQFTHNGPVQVATTSSTPLGSSKYDDYETDSYYKENSKTNEYKNTEKKVEKEDECFIGEDLCLMAKGTYIKNREYCGNSEDNRDYFVKINKAEADYKTLIDNYLLGIESLNDNHAIKYENVKISEEVYVIDGDIKIPRFHNKLNLFLIRYLGSGSYNIQDDIDDIRMLVSNIDSKKLRNSLMCIVDEEFDKAKKLETTIKGDSRISKLSYEITEDMVFLRNELLYEALNKYNVKTDLVVEKDGYENLYKLLSNINVNDATFVLLNIYEGSRIEFVASRDLLNEEKFIILITKKESIV